MAGKEEENYLDKLLGSVVEGMDTEEAKNIVEDADDSNYDKAEVIDAFDDINDVTGDSLNSEDREPEVSDEISQEPADSAVEQVMTQEDAKGVASESAIGDVMPEIAVTQETLENVQNDDIASQEAADSGLPSDINEYETTQELNEAAQNPDETGYMAADITDRVPDFSEPELSEGDLARLADMDLDTIIEDVSSETLSVEDLFGESGVGDIKLDPLPSQTNAEQNATETNEVEVDNAKADGTEVNNAGTSEAGVNDAKLSGVEVDNAKANETEANNAKLNAADAKTEEAVKNNNASEVSGTFDETSDEMADRTENSGEKVSAPQNLENSAVAAAASAVVGDAAMKKQGKAKKPKKSIGNLIKNILFESTEETPESSKAKKEAKKAEKEAEKSEKEAIKQDINAGEDGAEELDENERLIYEMYGDSNNADETVPPKMSFFSKIKYRIQQTIKKNQEEDRLEQEAEDKEYEERKKIKAEKKEVNKVKKDEAKQAKKTKQESKAAKKAKKTEKPKKVKKPKPEPKPGDILKIKPQAVVMFVLFVAGAIILISMLNSTVNYNNSVSAARRDMGNGNYSKAYEALSGLKLDKEAKSLYDQASAIMYVQRQYESYENYSKMGMHTEAINSLIKGLERYNQYYNKAVELGVDKQVDDVREEIVKTLEEEYKISETEAQKLLVMSKENFTQYYSRIEAYGEAKK